MASRMLVLVARRRDCGAVLSCVAHATIATRRGAGQVQIPEDPVAEEQRPYEEERENLLLL
jgi:hypothetical protein